MRQALSVRGRGEVTKSTSPIFLALSGLIVLPVRSMSRAVAAPTSLGSRWVPPHPGSKPSITYSCR